MSHAGHLGEPWHPGTQWGISGDNMQKQQNGSKPDEETGETVY